MTLYRSETLGAAEAAVSEPPLPRSGRLAEPLEASEESRTPRSRRDEAHPRGPIDLSPPTAWSRRFFVTAGSRRGREHERTAKNNQDGVAIRVHDDRIVAAVADGCSGGRYSEVGARLTAGWLVEHAGRFLPAREEPSSAALEALVGALAGFLGEVAAGLGGDLEAQVADHLLATFLLLVVDEGVASIVGVGDGVLAVDDRVFRIEAPVVDQPSYPAYRLLPGCAGDESPAPILHHSGRTDDFSAIAIATDGAAALVDGDGATLSRLLVEPSVLESPLSVQRRLNVEAPRLLDDTSVVLLRRRPR